ncbi:MAG TPA: hypothetical protein ENG98_02160 [Actinobacteria bacterium]|nr:hypothetical protein [Actinomycetota bacterium]
MILQLLLILALEFNLELHPGVAVVVIAFHLDLDLQFHRVAVRYERDLHRRFGLIIVVRFVLYGADLVGSVFRVESNDGYVGDLRIPISVLYDVERHL